MLLGLMTASAQWKLATGGVGIIKINEATDYGRARIDVVETGTSFSLADLEKRSAFASQGEIFYAWIQGTPPKNFKNQYGTPKYAYQVQTTFPDGTKSTLGGYSSFYDSGIAIEKMNAWKKGNYSVAFYLYDREADHMIPDPIKVFSFTIKE